MSNLFSMEGRLNRAKYFWIMFVIGLITYIIAFIIGLILGGVSMYEDAEPIASALGFIVGLGGTIISAFQVVKRLHDIERPGTHYWLLLIPFYNIYLGLVLLFKKGTDGPNQYGDDSLAKGLNI